MASQIALQRKPTFVIPAKAGIQVAWVKIGVRVTQA